MDRVTDDVLTLADVAKFWSRAPTSVRTEDEIFCLLVEAVWRGDLTVEVPAGHEPRNGDYRYSLLRAMAGVHRHPGLLFVRPGQPVDPVEEMLADGTTLLDLTKRISWVVDGEEPDETTAEAAFEKLASAKIDDYNAAVVNPILLSLSVDRDALRRYCETTGEALPTFWFKKTATRSTVSAERQCEKWLAELVRSGPKPESKPKLKSEARKLFPGLSGAAFDRVWDKAAPPEWKARGAPTKRKRNDNQ
jgi:hypothetical protein